MFLGPIEPELFSDTIEPLSDCIRKILSKADVH